MIILKVRDHIKKVDYEHKFDTAEDANLFKRYHLKFGNWTLKGEWKWEEEVKREEFKFAADEITEVVKGKVKRKLYIVEGLEIVQHNATEEKNIPECWRVLRNNRNVALKNSDWTQLADVTLSQEERTNWRKYRQYLRHLPKMYSDENVCSAEVMSYEEWCLRVR